MKLAIDGKPYFSRALAKATDFNIVSLMALPFTYDRNLLVSTVCAFLVLLFFFPFLEALSLNKLGTTPGKKLFGIRSVYVGGIKPSLKTSLQRSYASYAFGYWLGLPILSVLGVLYTYSTVVNGAETSWDQKYGFRTEYRNFSMKRYFVAMLVFGLIVSFGNTIEKDLDKIRVAQADR